MRRKLLAGTDLEVSVLCYGTGGFGTQVKGQAVEALIARFRQAGGNFLDTAHCYGFWATGGNGASERALGDYVRSNGKGDLVIATKGGHPSAPGYRQTKHWLAPAQIEADINDSLQRLGLDTIDLYWLHRDDTRMEVSEIMDTLHGEIARGRLRFIGASNWTPQRLEAANAYAAAHNLEPFVASQNEWSLGHKNVLNNDDNFGTSCRFIEESERAFHRRTQLPLLAYSSTARGYFASDGRQSAEGFDNPVSRARLQRAQELARRLDATANQIALAYLMHQDFPVFPILGSTNPEHLADALHSADLRLTPDQVAWLETA